MFTFAIALALVAPNPSAIDAPRKAFAACLKTFENNQMRAHVAADAYAAAVKAACPAEAQALSEALIKFDVAMGTKRASAQANAARDVDDYRLSSEERFRDLTASQ